METNTATVIYSIPTSNPLEEVRDDTRDKISIWRLPKIVWASAILFTANLIIVAGIAASPELNVNIYGEAAGDVVHAGVKPSPFVDPEPQKPKAVRTAVKLTPIIEPIPIVAMDVELANMPRASVRAAAYVSGERAYEAAETQIDLTGTTRAGSVMLRKTALAVHTDVMDVAPRQVSVREVRPVVIN